MMAPRCSEGKDPQMMIAGKNGTQKMGLVLDLFNFIRT